MRRKAVAASVLPTLLLSGCLFEESMDMTVTFNNATDQSLYLRIREPEPGQTGWYREINPNRSINIMLVGKGECQDRWVITKEDGTVAKDPGKICWHDTVTIP